MPPRAHKESASESETKQGTNSRSSNKARNAVAQAAQQEFLSKHINSNGPHDKPKIQPLDFMAFDDHTLDKYSKTFNLDIGDTQSLNDNILSSKIGKKTSSAKKNKGVKVPKIEKATALKKHFVGLPSRENEVITNFLYRVRNQDKDFTLSFK